MAQQIKAVAAHPDDLSPIPRLLAGATASYPLTSTHTNKINT